MTPTSVQSKSRSRQRSSCGERSREGGQLTEGAGDNSGGRVAEEETKSDVTGTEQTNGC